MHLVGNLERLGCVLIFSPTRGPFLDWPHRHEGLFSAMASKACLRFCRRGMGRRDEGRRADDSELDHGGCWKIGRARRQRPYGRSNIDQSTQTEARMGRLRCLPMKMHIHVSREESSTAKPFHAMHSVSSLEHPSTHYTQGLVLSKNCLW